MEAALDPLRTEPRPQEEAQVTPFERLKAAYRDGIRSGTKATLADTDDLRALLSVAEKAERVLMQLHGRPHEWRQCQSCEVIAALHAAGVGRQHDPHGGEDARTSQ